MILNGLIVYPWADDAEELRPKIITPSGCSSILHKYTNLSRYRNNGAEDLESSSHVIIFISKARLALHNKTWIRHEWSHPPRGNESLVRKYPERDTARPGTYAGHQCHRLKCEMLSTCSVSGEGVRWLAWLHLTPCQQRRPHREVCCDLQPAHSCILPLSSTVALLGDEICVKGDK